MEVILPKSAGFCFVVNRAVDTVYEQIKTGEKVYTYGPIIHNSFVVKDFESKGVSVINSEEELVSLNDGIVIIRSHGVSKHIYDLMEEHNIKYVDATCPFVKRIHTIVKAASDEGNQVVIVGNVGHPEVEGIKGWAECVNVIESVEEANNYKPVKNGKICIVSQTTFNQKKFNEIVEIFTKKGYDINVAETICNATEVRQNEARSIAKNVDAMIVIGDTQSSNSRKLCEISSEVCDNTYFVQTLEELQLDLPNSAERVGITAGASTPKTIIEEVQDYVRNFF